jgi:hypothetical protein
VRGETSREGKHRKITLLGRMRGGSAQQPAQPSADDIVAQVAAASDNLQDLGLDDMQEPIDDDEEYVDETTGKKKQRSWLGKLGKGISKRAQSIKSAVTGGTMTQEDQDALAAVMACRHPYAVKEGGIGIQDPEEARVSRCARFGAARKRPCGARRHRGGGGSRCRARAPMGGRRCTGRRASAGLALAPCCAARAHL